MCLAFHLCTCLEWLFFFFSAYAGVNIGGAGSYVYEAPINKDPAPATVDSAANPNEKWVPAPSRPPSKGTKRI